MPEVKDSLGLNVHFINPHNGREHAATIIRVNDDDTVNLIHYAPESGLQQCRFSVPYSLGLVANTFHWMEDDNAPQNEDEEKASQLARVTSVQNITGLPPTASYNVPPNPDYGKTEQPSPVVPTGSVELAQSEAPAVQPVSGVAPDAEQPASDPLNPVPPTDPDGTPQQEATAEQSEPEVI